jgi:aminoglycoside phosphotransferase (APT) family kinase protein
VVITRSGSQPVVLKRFPADRNGALAEWRALRAVERFPLPSPPPLFLDRDGAYFGEPAVVMGALPGTVLREIPRSVTWLRNAAAALARLHAIALTRVPAEIPARPRLLDRWTPDGLPPALGSAAADVIAELRRRAKTARRALCHGDFGLGNLLFAGETLTGIVDWERAKVMPPGNDVAASGSTWQSTPAATLPAPSSAPTFSRGQPQPWKTWRYGMCFPGRPGSLAPSAHGKDSKTSASRSTA